MAETYRDFPTRASALEGRTPSSSTCRFSTASPKPSSICRGSESKERERGEEVPKRGGAGEGKSSE